ncbi:MAG TPA: tetratricopeptide repeat protein [Candidatus Didemnitutus sp.]|nr:tetratricopeptide repeat protein [Candidatus Didemnitutus sp.]
MRRSILLIALLATTLQLKAGTDWALVHSRTMEAIDLMYNLDFGGAEKKCNEVIGLAPGDPRGHFFKSMTYYYRMSFKGGSKYDSAFWAFVYHAEKVTKVCERLLDQNENDTKAMFYMGGTIGFKGLAYVTRGETLKAIWDGKKGYDLLEEAVEKDPTNMDAKMGLGLFQYMISQAPDEFQVAIKLAGLRGDRWGGMRMLEEAASKGVYARQEAHRWLYGFYLAEDLPKRSIVHIRWLKDTFPKNWYFLQQYADISLYQIRDVASAEPAYKTLSNMPINSGDASYVRWLANFHLGEISLAKERYRESIEFITQAYSTATSVDLRNEAATSIGMAYDALGEREQAVSWYRKAGTHSVAQQNLNKGQSPEELLVDKIDRASSIGLYTRVISLADSVLASKSISDNQTLAKVLYKQGVAFFETGHYDRANACLTTVLGIQVTEQWVHPYAHYRLGMTLVKQDKTAAAKQQFSRVLEYEDYPSEDILRKRVAREKNALERNGK